MGSNANLHKANKAKKDEFYTQLPDIENELKHYKDFLKDKVIFCNCDDPYESNFFKYFAMNFNHLGLKKLICTSYSGSPIAGQEFSNLPLFKNLNSKKAYKVEITEVYDENGDGATDLSDVELLIKNMKNKMELLKDDGDFRSQECVELLKEADVVVTNPPFSLFREYIAQLVKYNKKFLIIGNNNAITYRDFFPLLKDNKVWLGYNVNKTIEFRLSDSYERWDREEDGKKYGKVPAISWFTNIDIEKRHEKIILYKKYTPNDYPTYENYDAIEVSKVAEIPYDYDGTMGVPITFLDRYNPEQFEIIGMAHGDAGVALGLRPYDRKFKKLNKGMRDGDLFYLKDGFPILPYRRILIKRKDNHED